MRGLTGVIKFDQHGLRSNFELEIVELKKDGLVKVGTWTEMNGVNFTRNFTESYTEIVESLQNKTLIVTTIFVSSILPKRRGRYCSVTRWLDYVINIWPFTVLKI